MSETLSLWLPPKKVENTKAEPDGLIFVTNASELPCITVLKEPGVVGKFAEAVPPPIMALPARSIARPLAPSISSPPRNVEYRRVEPVAFTFVTKMSNAPPMVVLKAPGVVGKSTDRVDPKTYTLFDPSRSTATRPP